MADVSLYPGSVSPDYMCYEFPKLNYSNANGKVNYWQIVVRIYDAKGRQQQIALGYWMKDGFPPGWYATITTYSGQVGGVMKTSTPNKVTAGKNLRKSNGTNPFTQAVSEANHDHIDHIKNREITNLGDIGMLPAGVDKFVPPQRLKKYPIGSITDFTHIYVQYKYDGVRAVAILEDSANDQNGSISLYSRRAEKYHCSAIVAALRPYMTNDAVIDGELWKQDTPLQEITSQAKNPLKDGRDLVYIIFDVYFPGDKQADQYKRMEYIKKNFTGVSSLLQVAPIWKINSAANLQEFYDHAVGDKHEGIVIRNFQIPYTPAYNGHQSDNYKWKAFQDDEFVIVDFASGEKGKAADLIMFICRTKEGKRFKVTPARPEEWRREELRKCEESDEYFQDTYAGREYTVQYSNLTVDGIPAQPVGKALPDEKA